MIVELSDAEKNLPRLVDAIQTGRETEIVITRNGRPVAKLVSTEAPIDVSKRLGLFEGKYPPMSLEDFDADNDEIAATFYGDNESDTW